MGDVVCGRPGCSRVFRSSRDRASHERACRGSDGKRRRVVEGDAGVFAGAGAGAAFAGAGVGVDAEVGFVEEGSGGNEDVDVNGDGAVVDGELADDAPGAADGHGEGEDDAADAGDHAVLAELDRFNAGYGAAAGPPPLFDRETLCVHGTRFATVATPLGDVAADAAAGAGAGARAGAGEGAGLLQLTSKEVRSLRWYHESIVLDGNSSAAFDRQALCTAGPSAASPSSTCCAFSSRTRTRPLLKRRTSTRTRTRPTSCACVLR